MGALGVTLAVLLQELCAAGAALRVREGRLEAKHPPPHLSALTKAHTTELRRLLVGPVPAVEALALPEPSPAHDPEPESPPPLAPIEAPAVDLEDPEELPDDAPPGFQHRYQPSPEHPALPPFRWSTLPPARRPDRALSTAPAPPALTRPEPPAGPVYGPPEPPERHAARFGYRIDASGSWLEPGEASLASFLPRFAVGHEPLAAELGAHRAQLAAIEGDCIARLGPLRGAAPLPEPSPDVLPERADAWRAAYRRRLAAGIDPESAARLTITTHGPQPGGIA